MKRLIGSKKLEVFESPNATRTVKVGYAGTLDPLASGLLICGFGKATQQLLSYSDADKTYSGTMILGNTTRSRDAATPEQWAEPRDISLVSDALLSGAMSSFVGVYEQIVPQYSAVHVKGEALYKTVQRGEIIDEDHLPRRHVTVRSFCFTQRSGNCVEFSAVVSKGTCVFTAKDLFNHPSQRAHRKRLRCNFKPPLLCAPHLPSNADAAGTFAASCTMLEDDWA
jgi:tRNA pseudouridine55 synthase